MKPLKPITKSLIGFGCLLAACAISIPIVAVCLKSCQSKQEKFYDKWEEYIWDRTFSIKIENQGNYVKGTFWIISDATKNDFSDFQYWIATNWHVMNQISTSTAQVSFSPKQNKIKESEYIPFKSFKQESNDKFYFDKSKNEIIDFAVAKVDMQNDNLSVNQSLNRLNKKQQETGRITDFAAQCDDKTHFENKQMYTAGFPINSSDEAVWESHIIGQYTLDYCSYNRANHKVFDKVDISPQYKAKYPTSAQWMDGGASGSMLLCDNDGTIGVCGIYWGGFSDEQETKLWPCFSIFNSSFKNFITEYI